MFVDEVIIIVKSGKGGAGAVSFRREKYVPRGGPDGGSGGKGGDVIIKANERLKSLYHLKLKPYFRAEDGKPGGKKNKTGSSGKDCVIEVPLGTVVQEKESNKIIADLKENGQQITVLHGGRGGMGNAFFATPVNRAPRYAQKGQLGEKVEFFLRLKMIADVGIVGLPNAGKSTLLSVLTGARPRIAEYPFTTLNPNLGVLNYKNEKQYIIADVPGLIEGAARGSGVGIKFLKHIERTKVLLILIDISRGNGWGQYNILKKEMEGYGNGLTRKPCLIVGSKIDIADSSRVEEFLNSGIPGKKLIISSVTGMGIPELIDEIVIILESFHGR